jgi:two-component system response regulator YesN
VKPIPVLIVDDEYLIRSLVRNSIDWPALGFDIVGEAEDGEEALRLVGAPAPASGAGHQHPLHKRP